ncbi:MAG: dehydratase [Nocardioidaceae bacterium]|nr:dehydratase [Nocardioidaceae bacterium]
MLKAALPVLPGVNLIPGIAKKGGALPELTLTREDVAIDADHVAAYAEVCGFPARQHLPLTYPHMLAFPLQMGVMTDRSFPYPAIGTVHLANTITQHRPITAAERLGVTVHPANLRAHPKGTVFDLLTTVTSGAETVWESTSEYLRVGKGDKSVAPEHEPLTVVPAGPITWKLPADLGRRYAAVSGDHNPIHLYPLTAKLFGFKQQIAHGMWTKARCVAALDNRLSDAVTVRVEFKKPVFLPGTVALGSRIADGVAEFSLTRPKDGAPHLVGRATPFSG